MCLVENIFLFYRLIVIIIPKCHIRVPLEDPAQTLKSANLSAKILINDNRHCIVVIFQLSGRIDM